MPIVNVIPLVKLPLRAQQIYSYSFDGVNVRLSSGYAVRIPFRGRIVPGIVTGTGNTEEQIDADKIKQIDSLIFPFPILTHSQIDLAYFMASYYFQPLSLIMKTMVPDLPEIISARQMQKYGKISFTLPQSSDDAPSSEVLMFGGKKLENFYIEKIEKQLSSRKQSIIITPEIPMVWRMLDILENTFKETPIAMFHGQIPPGEYLKNWLSCLSGDTKLILGTRQAIFAPLKKPGLIVVDAEHSMSHKQWDMNPRYDARTIAEKRSSIEKCNLIIASSAPRVNTYYRHKNSKTLVMSSSEIKADMADMKLELLSGNKSIVSSKLGNALDKTLADGMQALLIVNRRGLSSFVMCRDCGFTDKCPDCSSTLYEYSAGLLKCAHCAFKKPVPPVCPKCGSLRMKSFGLGIEQAKDFIVKAYPKIRTDMIHQDIAKSKIVLRKIYQSFDTGKTDILIGSPMALSWRPFNLGLIGFLNIDSIINSPEWLGHERAYSMITDALSGDPAVPVIIQTYLPENEILKMAVRQNYEAFIKDELSSREMLGYPPYTKLIKLFFRSETERQGLVEVERVKNLILQFAPPFSNGIQTIGPVKPYNSRVRGRFIHNLIIKLKPEIFSDSAFKTGFMTIASGLPSGWIIDVDPENLL